MSLPLRRAMPLLSFFFFPDWHDLFPLPLLSQGDSSLFGRHPLFPVLPTICLRLIDCVRSSSISASGTSITVLLFLLQQRPFHLSFLFFVLSLSLSLFACVLVNDSANNGINGNNGITDLSFFLALTFVPSLCRSSRWEVNDPADVRIIRMSATIWLGIKIFQSAEVDDRRGSRLPLHHARGCCIINFRSSIRCVRTCKQWS